MTDGNAARKRVLVVEDDHDILQSVEELLSVAGYAVSTARNGQDAIDQLLQARELPQLILLDLMMPGKDGFAFRREMLSYPTLAPIPVFIMSADGHVAEKQATLGALRYLKKPLDVDDMLQALQAHFG